MAQLSAPVRPNVQPRSRSPGSPYQYRALGWIGLALVLACAAWALWSRGGAFYRLDDAARVDHPDYHLLSPARPVGHAYGFIATALVFANLAYLLRRRVVTWRLGSMRAWLDVHVATGLLAGLFGLAHSAFQFRNPAATVTMIALAVTLASGIIGRFLFLFVPTMDHARLAENCKLFDVIVPGFGGMIARGIWTLPVPNVSGRVTLPKVLWLLPTWLAVARSRRRMVRQAAIAYQASASDELRLLRARILETEDLVAKEARAIAFDYLMRSWRGLHRFFALLMIALMVLHGAVAWYYGYRWIFSEPAAF